jgi:predicted transcriptional regulator
VRSAVQSAFMTSRAELLAALDEAIARGLADCDAGRVTPADEVFDRLQAKYENLARLQDAEPDDAPG